MIAQAGQFTINSQDLISRLVSEEYFTIAATMERMACFVSHLNLKDTNQPELRLHEINGSFLHIILYFSFLSYSIYCLQIFVSLIQIYRNN